MNREDLFEHLKNNTKVLTTDNLARAFAEVDRADFIDDDYRSEAYEDYAVPLLNGQSISQPSTVAFMLELLGAHEGERVLDIGSGSGYTTALLGSMVGGEGSVLGLEILPELVEKSQQNIKKYDFGNMQIMLTDPRWSPTVNQQFDKILVSAAASELPSHLLSKLSVGGTLVIPISNSIYKIEKINEEEFLDTEYPGFTFVPLV